ncbi:MAG: YolD-like family protein [Oscillospiraceae bacterium]|nr:YolD-like family protein [Oscillospiraceae bacterium]
MAPRPKMTIAHRAKQFAPFAAITGLDQAIDRQREELGETERRILAEESAAALDRSLRALRKGSLVTLGYYCAGRERSVSGPVERIEETDRVLRVAGVPISFDDILSIRLD